MKIAIPLFLILFLSACGTTNQPDSSEMIYWVNSQKVDCQGVAPMKCLQVQKGENKTADQWEYMYANIDGFDFEPGFQYKLVVKEEQLDPKDIPADASSIKYTLIKVLEKNKVKSPMMDESISNQEWSLKMINGTTVDKFDSRKAPTMLLMAKDKKISGTDGCNNYFGNIEEMDGNSLKVSMLGKTKMACINNKLPELFSDKLSKITSYKMMNDQLILLDASGDELLIFGK